MLWAVGFSLAYIRVGVCCLQLNFDDYSGFGGSEETFDQERYDQISVLEIVSSGMGS